MKDNYCVTQAMRQQISDFIGTNFTPSGNSIIEFDGQLKVIGTITRHGTITNVEVTLEKTQLEPMYWRVTDETITISTKLVGTIQLGKKVCVSDPCYSRDVWCMTTLNNVKPGRWNVIVGIDTIDTWGERLYILELFHSSVSARKQAGINWTEKSELGVDSGTMSVFDDAYYRRKNGSSKDFEADSQAREDFMDECFQMENNFGFFSKNSKNVGFICSSGIGDGCYPLYVSEDVKGEIVGMKISFM